MGTRFWLFPQTPTDENSLPAEVVELSPPAGSLDPGPEDDSMYVIFPVDKHQEYGMHKDRFGRDYVYLPPWDGDVYERPVADEAGHFLHYNDVDDARFHATHIYASIRFTLDVWEGYYQRPIKWHFRNHYDKCEVNLLPDFDNAIIGYGFVEVGTYVDKKDRSLSPFSLNFDVLAHEVGHGIVYAEVGMPDPRKESAEYLGFQESCADIVSMVATLHFDSIIDEVLESTSGNLYMHNHLNRFAETSSSKQIRLACNNMKLSDFAAGWRDEHILAQPLTGAIFDILVDIFHEELVRVGAISTSLEEVSDKLEGTDEYESELQEEFEAAYSAYTAQFREALIFSRDRLATLMIETWSRLEADHLEYLDVQRAMLEADKTAFSGQYHTIINVNFAWREIGMAVVGPKLPRKKDDPQSHTHSNRTVVPLDDPVPRKSYRERYDDARR
ncbi:MAG: hypothetical protein KTR18_11860 [Acidiferrobacterales bacterium]|nr:hypothetical protein [Acidiferrobacterales bacterium]